MDESVTYCILAGVVVFLGVLWALWGAWWLRRVELHRDLAGVVRGLGLAWQREGLGPSVVASGVVGARHVEVRWRRGVWRDRLRARVDGTWVELTDVGQLETLLTPPSA